VRIRLAGDEIVVIDGGGVRAIPFDHCSITANPDPADGGPSPTWTYAVVPPAPVVPVPTVPVIVITVAPMILSVALIMVAPMILVMIVAFRVTLILIVPMIAVAFSSEGRYGKQQSSRYCTNNREFENHWFLLCCVSVRGQDSKASLQLSH
jgi:hypothetical protein